MRVIEILFILESNFCQLTTFATHRSNTLRKKAHLPILINVSFNTSTQMDITATTLLIRNKTFTIIFII